MSQSSYITAMLLAGFIIFVAAKNRLSTYTAILWGATTAPKPSGGLFGGGGSSSSSSSGLADWNTFMQGAKDAATVAPYVAGG